MILINGTTGLPVTVPVELVERFKAAGFTEPAAPAPVKIEKPTAKRRRARNSE